VTLRQLLACIVLSICVFLCFGLTAHFSKGYQQQIDNYEDLSPVPNTHNITTVMLLGDSHAMHLKYGLNHLLKNKVLDRSAAGCIPLFGVDRFDSRFLEGACEKQMSRSFEEFSSDSSIDTLILSTMGPVYLDNIAFRDKNLARVQGSGVVLVQDPSLTDRWKIFEVAMLDTFERLSKISDRRVVFVIDVPELGISPKSCVSNLKRNLFGKTLTFVRNKRVGESCQISRKEYDARVTRYKELVYRVSSKFPNIIVVDPTSIFCDDKFCSGFVGDVNDSIPLYGDFDHLSEYGSILVANLIIEQMFRR
jgi:hypothetical protein